MIGWYTFFVAIGSFLIFSFLSYVLYKTGQTYKEGNALGTVLTSATHSFQVLTIYGDQTLYAQLKSNIAVKFKALKPVKQTNGLGRHLRKCALSLLGSAGSLSL